MPTQIRRRATLPAAFAAAALAIGVLAPVAQAQTRPFTTAYNAETQTWYTIPDGIGNVSGDNAPRFEGAPGSGNPNYETQFVSDAVSDDPCEVTFTLTNATNLPYFIVYRIDDEPGIGEGEWEGPWDGRLGVTGDAASPETAAARGHTWGFEDAEITSNTVDLRDLEGVNLDADSYTIEYAVAGPERNYINPDVAWYAEQWKTVEVEGCAENGSGSLGSIGAGSLGSMDGDNGSLSDSSGSDTGPDGSLASLACLSVCAAGSAEGSLKDGSLEGGSLDNLPGSVTASLDNGSGESGSLEVASLETGSAAASLEDLGSTAGSLAPLGSAVGSLPLVVPVALIGGSIAAAPMIQQSLAGLNIQLPALPALPPLAGSAMPGTPPIAAPAPAPGPSSPNGRG